MSDRDDHNEDNGVPMELFWLGNLDEGNQVDADYLDEDARQHLAGLTKLDLGTQLVDLAEGETVVGKDEGGERIQQAADALDFADEDELIEDASAPVVAPASYAAVGAALATGGAAEDEDYDFDEAEPSVPAAPPQPAPPAPAPAPISAAAAPQQPQPTAATVGDGTSQAHIARARGIKLPMLGKDPQGDAVLAFTDLFRSVSKQSSSAAHQRERKVRFADAATTTPSQQQPLPLPSGENEVDKALLLLKSGSEKLAELGVDVILQKEPAARTTETKGLLLVGEEEIGKNEQLQLQKSQQTEAAASLVHPDSDGLVIGGGAKPGTKGLSEIAGGSKKPSTAAPISKPTTTTTTAAAKDADGTAGPLYAVLPPCVFDPVIQQIWELKINNNSSNGSVFDRGVNDTSSEHETDEEEEGEKIHRADGVDAGTGAAAATTGNGGDSIEMMAVDEGEERTQQAVDMEEDQQEEAEEEEKKSEEIVLAKKLAAEMKAAREHVIAWDGTAFDNSTTSDSAADPEDVVNVLGTAPLLRYSNPIKKLFAHSNKSSSSHGTAAATTTTVQPGSSTAAVPAPVGDEAGTSAAAAAAVAGPSSEAQPPAADQAAQQQQQQQPETAATAAAAAPVAAVTEQAEVEEEEEDTPALPIVAASRVPTWESDIILEGGSAAADRLKKLPLTLDLNDPGLVLQNIARKNERNNTEFKKLVNISTATVMPYQKRVTITAKGVESTNEAILELAKINISRDGDYFAQPKRRAGSGGIRAVHHARPASELITIPLSLEPKELMLYHRPRGFWWPIEPAKGIRNPAYPVHSTVIIETLTGATKLCRGVNLTENTPTSMWEYIQPMWKLQKDENYPLPHFLVPGKPRPTIVSPDVVLNKSGIPMRGKETMEIVTAYRHVELKPTSVISIVPDESNSALLRPPMAFTLHSELRAGTPGRVVLVEYLQDAPLLLNRPGMGARLATYYRRKGAGDTGHQKIRNAADEAGQRWRVGAMNPINEDDESPFLGELDPGTAQLSVETGLFTAPAAPHAPLESDFLLTRGPSGYMSVREITGAVASGQQLPLHRIPVPGSRDLKDLEERLIFVHVFRVLRERKLKEERRFKKYESNENRHQLEPYVAEIPSVSLKELSTLFPSRPQTALRLFIKDVCGLKLMFKDRTGDEYYRVDEGARMPSEPELRRKFTPEDACVLEACRVAEYRMQQSGLMKAVKFNYGNVAADKLRLAAEMLPTDELTQAAAKAVEAQYITAAWNLTDAFMSSFREGRATMRLLGPGDPTGRGVGYSYVRDVRHKGTGNDDPTKAINKQKSGKVQGTDADLRRMTTEQAKKKLIDFGLDAAEIEPLGRWVRIDLVRQLANASAADGSVAGIAKYVRHQKTTLIELQKQYRERAQEIFNRQMAVLNDSAAEELGDQAALEAELEAELAAEEREEEGGELSPLKKGANKKSGAGGRENSPSPEDEARQLEEMRAAGLLGSSPGGPDATAGAAGADGAGPSTSAATAGTTTTISAGAAAASQQTDAFGYSGPLIPGQTRRIRREVLCRFTEDGSFQKIHEVVYTGRDRPFLLASLYQKEGQVITGPWGFGHRVINYSRGEKRLTYNASRGRGTGRGRGRGGGRPPAPRAGGGGKGSRGGGKGRGKGRARARGDDYDEYDDCLDYSAIMNVGSRNTRRARAVKKKEDDFIENASEMEDFEDIVSDFDDDEEFDARTAELEEQGFVVVKEKKKPAVPRVPRQPKPVELGPDGQPLPKKPKQPKKLKAPLTEEELEKQRQRQQREASPQFISGHDLDAILRAEGALDDEDGPAEVINKRINRVRTAGTTAVRAPERVIDVAPVEWDPDAPLTAATASTATRPASVRYYEQQVSGDEEYYVDDEDEDDEDYVAERKRKQSTGGAGGTGRTRSRGNRTTRSVAPVPQPTRASSRSAAGSKKRDRYDDEFSDEDVDEDYGSDMTDSPKRRRSGGGGGGGGGGKKKSKTSGGFGSTAAFKVAPPRTTTAAAGGGAASLIAGAKALGAVFVHILDAMKKEGDDYKKRVGKLANTYFSIFGDPVPSRLTDYGAFVPDNKRMWLRKVRLKASKGEYYDVESVMNDLRQIRDNARLYNDPVTGGRFKFPECISFADGIVTFVEERLKEPEYQRAIATALDQIAAARSGYQEENNAQSVEDYIVAFDPSANYSLEPLAAPAAAPAVLGTESQVAWVLCEKCKAWRILEPGINPAVDFECRMKNGFTCDTPLEPGGTYDGEEEG